MSYWKSICSSIKFFIHIFFFLGAACDVAADKVRILNRVMHEVEGTRTSWGKRAQGEGPKAKALELVT